MIKYYDHAGDIVSQIGTREEVYEKVRCEEYAFFLKEPKMIYGKWSQIGISLCLAKFETCRVAKMAWIPDNCMLHQVAKSSFLLIMIPTWMLSFEVTERGQAAKVVLLLHMQ